jgi:TolB-like protein/Flp pilus assembly protein TadD
VSGQDDSPADSARPTAFLSYARANKAQAAKLVVALERAGLDIWWDTRIEGGAAFAARIGAALDGCDAVIVLWSDASISSDWVLDEASRGRKLRKLVPISLDGSPPPLGFGQYHAIKLDQWNGESNAPEIAEIVRGVAAAAGQALHELPAAAPVLRAPANASRRRLLIAGVSAAVAGGAGLIAFKQGLFASRPAVAANSVAVLPFENLSGNKDQEYFSDGLSEELRATLARNLKLQVMAQASSARFRDRQQDAVGIAAALGVAFLLDGSVRRAGEAVRITADLVDGATGFSRWSQTFERQLQDIFAVQTEIASTVAAALVAQVAPESATATGGTTSVEAYDAYLRGRSLYELSVDEASERAALAQFDTALGIDPNYAAAHAAKSRSLTAIANQYGKLEELGTLYAAAVAEARRAIEIAPAYAEGQSTLGFTLFQGQLDSHAAREPFERSRELGAGEATVLARYALYCARNGRRQDAAAAMDRALVLDKLNPLIYRAAGLIRCAADEWADAIPWLRKALEMNPGMSQAHAAIGDALLMLGRTAEARAEYEAEPLSFLRLAGLAIVAHRLGEESAAQAALAQMVDEQGDRTLYQQAQVLAQWGRRDAAIAALQRALRLNDSGLTYSRNDPMLDPLRDDPRFAQLLQSIGFD